MIRTSSFLATTVKLLGAAALGAALAAPAQATVITFEGSSGAVMGKDNFDIGALNVGFFDFDRTTNLVGSFVTGSSQSTYYSALGNSYVDIYAADPLVSMQLQSFDASLIGASTSQSAHTATYGALEITGWTSNNDQYVERYNLTGPGANGFELTTYTTSATFRSQLFVYIAISAYGCNAQGNCGSSMGQFGIDNINLKVLPEPAGAPMPEPASLALLGLGILGLAVARRRKA